MQGWMAPTDIDWFTFLASQPALEEVNFWTPSSHFAFRAQPGTPFLFKLKAPHSAIAGYGLFQRYDRLPEWLAWEAFGVIGRIGTIYEVGSSLGQLSSGFEEGGGGRRWGMADIQAA